MRRLPPKVHDHLYGGALGQALVAHVRSLGGCLTLADLESVEPVWLDPLVATYRGLDVHTLPPPCEGFQYLLTLRILDGFDLARMERNGVDHLDTVYRAIRLAAGTRIAHNNPSAERLAALMSDDAVADASRRACATASRSRDRPSNSSAPTQPAHHVVLGRRWRRQRRVHHPEPRREVRLRRGGAGPRRVPQQFPVLGRGRSARTECIAPRRTAGAADGAEHRHTQRHGRCWHSAHRAATASARRSRRRWSSMSISVSASRTRSMRRARDCGTARRVQVESAHCRRHHRGTLRTWPCGRSRRRPWTPAVGGMHGIAIDPATGVMTGGCDPRRDGFVAAA